jgi:hypothetical protein
MSFFTSKKLVSVAFIGSLLAIGCGPGPAPSSPILDMTNDTYDSVDVYIDNVYMDTLTPASTHSYDMAVEGSHRVVLTLAGASNYVLNDLTNYYSDNTVSAWDVYDNSPVVLVENDFSPIAGECVTGFVDTIAAQFAIEGGSTTVFDATVCQGETGFYLVSLDTHRVEVYGYTTSFQYHDDTRAYADADHVTFQVP